MPGWRRSFSIAAVVLAMAPAGAAAQSAGDEQYEDPFGNQQAQATPAPAAPAQAPATTPPAPGTPAPAAPTRPAPTGAQAAPVQLPRTGGDTRLPAVLGLVLLSAGVALRARARRVS
jgi:LPXTG-motif cell wall-anchored protein